MEDFFLNIVYKNKTVKFRIVNPEAPLNVLMNNLRHAIGKDGRLIFDFPSIDQTGAPLDYFFGKEDATINEVRIEPVKYNSPYSLIHNVASLTLA